jgi:hypothetical protein
MYDHDEYAGFSDIVYTPRPISDAEAFRADRPCGVVKVTLRDIDLPAKVSNGVLYIQAPLGLIFEAFAEDLPDFLGDMEIRISDSHGRAFSLDRDGRPFLIPPVVVQGMVRSRRRRGPSKLARRNAGAAL